MEGYDTIVIGGGPVGLRAARLIAESGFTVSVIEKNKEIGFPNHCSGLVSANFVSKYAEAEETVLNGIKGAMLICGNAELKFKDEKFHAFAIDREKFDKLLAEKAKMNGVKILTEEEPESAEKDARFTGIRLKSGKTLQGRTFIIASGANSGVSKLFGLYNKPAEIIRTVQTEAKMKIPDKEIVYVFANRELFGNWFGWIIPTGNSTAKIGLGTDRKENIMKLFDRFVSKTEMLKNASIKKKPVAWIIPIGISRKTANLNALIAGDSAMQVKPFSGGGLFTGMLGGEIAAQVIASSLKSNSEPADLSEYEKLVSEKITPVIKRGLILRKIYKSMPDQDKAMFLNALNNEEAKKVIISYGDIDSPYLAGLKLLKFIGKPLLKYFAEMLRSTI